MSGMGVIFDLDGVIVDTARYHYAGWKKLADQLGVDFNEQKNEKLKGVSRRESLLAMLGYTPSEKDIERYCALKNGFYLEFISRIDRNELLPGALRLLREIHTTEGWMQALASASRNAKFILDRLEIMRFFDAVVDGHDFQKSKPDPEVFQIAADRLCLPPSRLVVFEDAESGIQAAKAAGMFAIGVGDAAVLCEADMVVQDLAEINLMRLNEFLKVAPCC